MRGTVDSERLMSGKECERMNDEVARTRVFRENLGGFSWEGRRRMQFSRAEFYSVIVFTFPLGR